MANRKHEELAALAIAAWKENRRIHSYFDSVCELYTFMLKIHGRADFAAALEKTVVIH